MTEQELRAAAERSLDHAENWIAESLNSGGKSPPVAQAIRATARYVLERLTAPLPADLEAGLWRILDGAFPDDADAQRSLHKQIRPLLQRAAGGRADDVAQCIREIRGDVDDRTLIDRLVEVQGFLRHGTTEAT